MAVSPIAPPTTQPTQNALQPEGILCVKMKKLMNFTTEGSPVDEVSPSTLIHNLHFLHNLNQKGMKNAVATAAIKPKRGAHAPLLVSTDDWRLNRPRPFPTCNLSLIT